MDHRLPNQNVAFADKSVSVSKKKNTIFLFKIKQEAIDTDNESCSA